MDIIIDKTKTIPDGLIALCRNNLRNRLKPKEDFEISLRERIRIRDDRELMERKKFWKDNNNEEVKDISMIKNETIIRRFEK